MRLKLILAYDGTRLSGWQSQASGNAVQDLVEKAFLQLVGRRVVVHGAGRTDSGVHALRQCAHADVPDNDWSLTDWRRALNANLPREIRVLRASRASVDFHARFSAVGKVYRYRIWNAEILPPLECDRAWHVPTPLDFSILSSAAKLFRGRHNFASFSAKGRKDRTEMVRIIYNVRSVRHSSQEIHLTFEGEGFLYKMVRMLTGALVRVAQGREDVAWIRHLLVSHGTTKNYVAPACGLYLVRVLYPKNALNRPTDSTI